MGAAIAAAGLGAWPKLFKWIRNKKQNIRVKLNLMPLNLSTKDIKKVLINQVAKPKIHFLLQNETRPRTIWLLWRKK